MFTYSDLRSLLDARPFVPFRLVMSDGGSVEVRSQEVVLPLRRFAVIGLLDPNSADTPADRYTTVWYMHVSRAEQMQPGSPPFATPPGPAGSPSHSPT